MCNFVPGECLAIAENDDIYHRLVQWKLPGRWELIPLIPEEPDMPHTKSSPRRKQPSHVFIHLTGIPDGLEVLAVSKLSAALSDLIGSHRAVVELNLYLPMATQQARRRRDQLSPQAARLVSKLREHFSRNGKWPVPLRPIALLDSGINFSSLRTTRPLIARNYTGSRATFGQIVDIDHGAGEHGTDVCRILDSILPDSVPIISGQVASRASPSITVLKVATAFAHLVAADRPAVVNLSLAPRDDQLVCPRCRRAIPVEAFHSLILPFVFRVAGPTALTVMAAGNRGQISNARHALAETTSLALVEATDSSGNLAAYSNRVDSGHATAVRFFGGDNTEGRGRVTVFENAPESFGTSYAAPFASAAAYAYWAALGGGSVNFDVHPKGTDFGSFCSRDLGMSVDFRPSILDRSERIGALAMA